MDAVKRLDSIIWENVIGNLSRASVTLDLHAFFNVKRELGDGNCFYRALSRIHSKEKTDDNHLYYRLLIPDAAERYFDNEPEAIGLSLSKEEYISKAIQDGEWAGSLEASMLSKFLEITIIIWIIDDSGTVISAQRYGIDRPSEAYNLGLVGNTHFDSLTIQVFDRPYLSQLSLIGRLESIEELLFPDEVEPSPKTPHNETFRQRNPSRAMSIETETKLIEKSQGIPLRIGRIVEMLFSCRLGFILESDLLLVTILEQDNQNSLDIRKLGYHILTKDKRIRKEFSNCKLKLDDAVWAHLDESYLLRFAFPGFGLHRFIPMLLPSFIEDVLIVCLAILLSSFLYKSKIKFKRDFIINCCRSVLTSGKKVARTIKKTTTIDLYQRPQLVLKNCCEVLYGKLVNKIMISLKGMSGENHLLLRNLDFSSLSLDDYLKLLKTLSKEDLRDKDFISKELKSLNKLSTALNKLKEDNQWNTKEKEKLIAKFFEEKNLLKFVGKSGKVSGSFQLGNVLAYTYNLFLNKDTLNFSQSDIEQISIEIRKFQILQEGDTFEPVALICNKLEPYFLNAFKKLPTDCHKECKVLFDDVRNSVSHTTAWKHALRLKGTMYEGYFSKHTGWKYIPEDLKPTLMMTIQTFFPEKFVQFLEKTQLHPEFRDLTPDFMLTQRLFMEGETNLIELSSQLKIAEGLVESVEAIPFNEHNVFPLPEVSISEVRSIEGIVKQMKESASSSNSKQNRFYTESNNIEMDQEKSFSIHQLLFIEVGYQTDVEGKVLTDSMKWKEVLKMLSLLGIKATLIVCVDNTKTHPSDWWINEELVHLLKGSMGHLFSKLSRNTPVDVTDVVVGSISTQKIRSFLKSGTSTKTPLSAKDVQETWKSMSNFIINRDTDVQLSNEYIGPMYVGLVEGVSITSEGTDMLMNMLKENSDLFIDEFEKTKYKHEVNKNVETAEKMLLAWLSEDLEGCRCRTCLKDIFTDLGKTVSTKSRLAFLARSCTHSSHPVCCHPSGIKIVNKSNLQKRMPDLASVRHQSIKSLDDDDNCVTELDRLIRLTLPGKTEKEKKVKRSVDCLIKLMMMRSELNCIKLPSGQIIMLDSVTKSNITKTVKVSKHSGGRSSANREEVIKKNLCPSKLNKYSEHVRSVIESSIKKMDKQQNSNCRLSNKWLETIVRDLSVPLQNEEILDKVKKTINDKRDYVRNNDKLIVRGTHELLRHINSLRDPLCKMPDEKIFTPDCVLFKEMVAEAMLRYQSTAYQGCVDNIMMLLELLLEFMWYQELLVYSKICETFLRICTEFNRAGLKLLKVRHLNINIAVKLPANKKQNMQCRIYNLEGGALTDTFFLNRRQAIIGAAYPYILLVLYIQILQQQRCIEELDNRASHIGCIRNRCDKLLSAFSEEATNILNGHFEEAHRNKTQLCKASGNFLTKPSHENFINVISGLNIVYGAIMRDSFLANSQPQNKQLQNIRYGMLNGISRLSCPSELGKKFSSSCRRIEDNLSRLYIQSVIYSSVRDVEKNVIGWKELDLCPEITIPCFSIYGLFVNSDRQLIFDIYNVHIYNKEMDDFDEGCISVLEETADRHMNWELDLKRSWKDNADQRSVRLLLGIPNVHRSSKKGVEKEVDGVSEASSSLRGSCLTRRSCISNSSSASSLMNKYTTIIKPIEIDSGIFLESDVLRQGRAAATGGPRYYCYTPNKASVLKDCISIIRRNPSYTYGSFELIQAATEYARGKYPQEAICRARRDPRNWVSISEVTETTSIVSTPRTEFYVKDCFKINTSNQNKKLAKLIKNKMKRLGSLFSDNDVGRKDCTALLSTVDGLTSQQKKDITNAVFEPSKLAIYNWSQILKKSVYSVLLTHDGNVIYCWIKSLSLMVKSKLKKHLSFMGVERDDIPKPGFFNEVEIQALIKVRNSLTCNKQEEIDNLDTTSLVSSWMKCLYSVKSVDSVYNTRLLKEMLAASEELYDIRLEHMILIRQKKENSYTSFIREELAIKGMERSFIKKYDNLLVRATNLLFYIAVTAPWCMHYKALEAYLVKHPEILDINCDQAYSNGVLSLTVNNMVNTLYREECNKGELEFDKKKNITLRFFVRYLVTLFSSNTEPFSMSLNDDEVNIGIPGDVEERLLSQTKKVFAKLGLSDKNYDFIWTTQMIANSNFNVCKKLTGRSEGERLPRSIRSKVVYEMVKLVGESGMAILQQLAFAKSLHYNHRFFSVLAPKAQLGGSRDLLVQETGTKVIHATTEAFSRSLLRTTSDDGLTNQHLKETILNVALDSLTTMRTLDGEALEGSTTLVNFHKVVCISGDNTKWGPIHCCSFFSGMMQQLLKDHPDWSAFYRLTFLKNLCRQIEIPAASVKKIINVAKLGLSDKQDIDSLTEKQAQDLLENSAEKWADLPYVKFLILTYLRKGKLAMNSYNHMGQGIHHATSSILTSVMAETFESLCIYYYKKVFPNLNVSVTHAGSSDDYAKVIIVTGVVDREQYDLYNTVFWNHTCRFKNYMSAINRCCQMKDSAKTLVSDCFLEFYSEFMMGCRVTPAVIKFIFTGLINSSVTSPSSLTQACHVSSQQAMFNSVPMLTNIAFTLSRQQIFFNHVEAFIRKYGPITLGSISQFGRLYCPKYSNLVNTSVTMEDCESIISACDSIVKWDALFDTPLRSEVEEELNKDIEKRSTITSETSSIKSDEMKSNLSFSKRRSLTEEEVKFLKVGAEESRYTDAQAVEERINKFYTDSKDQDPRNKDFILNSILCNSCSWIQKGKEKCFLEAVVRIQMLLRTLCFGYYRSFCGQGLERQIKSSLNRDENQIIEDPMIQLIPEKLRRELERLGLSRMSIEELLPKNLNCVSISQVIAQRLIGLNVSTESYSAEVARLKQTLTARNVLYGLAGGVKELSIPIYTIFMKSYFFKDNVFLDLKDRWLTVHSSNYRDSSGRKLDGKIVTKYTHWLSVFMNCSVAMDSISELSDPSLFNDSLKCISVSNNSNGQRVLSLIKSHLLISSNELKHLVLQFSNLNRRKMKIVESRPPEYEMEANKVVITKSGLFTAGEGVRLNNNPAVVIGYLLDESSISEVKPTKVDFPNLLKDKFKLSQFFPSLDTILKMIKQESDAHLAISSTPDLHSVSKYVNYLTLMCRMMLQTNSSVTVFYMIKSNKLTNEPTVSDLICYGMKEGRHLKLPEAEIDTSTYSVKYWKILQCISCIGQLPISDANKRDILFGFMNWKVTSCESPGCPIYKEEKSVLTDFVGQTILHVLASELHLIKDRTEREALSNLIDYIISPAELIKKKPYLGTTASFRTWGNGSKDGRFTYSSRSGEASGIFIGAKLHIYMSNENISLLDEVERNVLGWINQRRTEVFTIEQHEIFINLLPSIIEFGSKSSEGKTLSIVVDKSNPRYLKYVEPKKNSKQSIVKVKKQILTVKKINNHEFENDPKLLWSKSGLSIIFEETSTDVTYHERIAMVRNMLSDVLNVKPLQSLYQDTQTLVSKVKFSDTVVLNSAALLHSYLVHAPLDVFYELGSKQTILKSYINTNPLLKLKLPFQSKLSEQLILDFHKHTPFETDTSLLNLISEKLTKSMLPIDSWPELQSQLENQGISNFILNFKPEPSKGYLTWDLQPNVSIGKLILQDLRDIVSSMISRVIPPAFLVFLFSPNLLNELFSLSSVIVEFISLFRISYSDIDRMVISTLYCFQSESKKREGPVFKSASLLALCRKPSFFVDNRTEVTANEYLGEISLSFKVKCLDSHDMRLSKAEKKALLIKNLEDSVRGLMSDHNITINSINKEFDDFNMLTERDSVKISFTAKPWDNHKVDYIGLMYKGKEKKEGNESIVNFILFLLGCGYQTAKLSVHETSNNDLCLDDILENTSPDTSIARGEGNHHYFSDDEY
nr:RNA-dependent RNA polymerase [Nairoviridae sp.]